MRRPLLDAELLLVVFIPVGEATELHAFIHRHLEDGSRLDGLVCDDDGVLQRLNAGIVVTENVPKDFSIVLAEPGRRPAHVQRTTSEPPRTPDDDSLRSHA